jgi:hypothetical protein
VTQADEADDGDDGSLRAAGWRQGCGLNRELPFEVIVTDEQGNPTAIRDVHGQWAVASQDCELAHTPSDHGDATIELRPAFPDSGKHVRGVRSRQFVITEGLLLDGQSPRITVAASVLTRAAEGGGHDHSSCPTIDERRSFKTWLGLRYDRPAVPGAFLTCQSYLAKALNKPKIDEAHLVRDVMVSYALDSDGVVRYTLVAVVPAETERVVSETERASIEKWLTEGALAVPAEHGVAERIAVLPSTRVSLDFLEKSYAISEIQDVTWPRRGGGPIGESSS